MSTRLRPRRPEDVRIAWLAFALASAGALLAPFLAKGAWLLPRCGLKAVTGWPCPTCGSTRALGALARFDVADALRQNPLVAAGALFGLAAGFLAPLVVHGLKRVPVLPARAPRWLLVAALAAAAANWLYLVFAGI